MSKLSFGQANRGGGYWIHLAFILMLCVFAILKTGDLNTPYFWDELGVYVPGALAMKDNGTIGLLPSSLEPLYSRGHPLVFVFSQAAWFNLVGDTVVEGHVFSLLLGLITLGVFYICTADLFGKAVALFSSVLLAFQPMFFAMSGVILPEMMLTLFTIPAIWGLIRRRWLIYIVSASLAIMTKELAIIIPALALLVAGWDAVADRKIFSLRTLTACFSALFPLLVYGGFLLIQKKQNGWYFFPEHMGYLRLDSSLIDQGWNIFRDMFIRQGKLIIGPVLILVDQAAEEGVEELNAGI